MATNPRAAPVVEAGDPAGVSTSGTLFAEAPAGGAPTKAADGGAAAAVVPGRPAHSSPALAAAGGLAPAPAPGGARTATTTTTVATRTTKTGVPCRLPLFYE
jgi:hypothetical protein